MTPSSAPPTAIARRTLLVGLLGLAASGASCTSSAPRPARSAHAAPLPAGTTGPDTWGVADERTTTRLLDRVTWGCTARGAQALGAQGTRGIGAYLAQQLRAGTTAALPAAAQAQIDTMVISRTPIEALALDMEARQREAKARPTEDERKAALNAWQQDMRALQQEAATRHVLRALYSPTPLREKMTWFWMNHFNVFAGKGNLRALVGDYEERAVRPHAMGRFRDLLGATVRHPAMLHYLDNAQNAAGRINENYARELMELHTLGVDGGYSQQDVQELARVLTGVGISLRPLGDEPPRMKPALRRHYVREGLFEFNPQRHDWDPKTLLGQPLKSEGLAEVDEALDRLARAPATARFITRKIALFMVGDQPTPALLQTLARTFERTDGDIAAVLQALFATAEFRASLGQRFRDPVHYVLASLRLAHGDAVLPSVEPALGWLQRLAEPLYGRATPDGYPLDTAAWSGSGQMASRFDIARAIGAGGAGGAGTAVAAPASPDMGMAPSRAPAASSAPPAAARTPPPLAQSAYVQAMLPSRSAATRQALEQATSPREWNLLFLASPEFMYG
ncbi:DUF1800 domain-containing protein [Acidovorax sp. 1608163]|uniref:DUF1800 domain-containing protein n=1 Tax=Acidovorax sp. 1608163 TaxID=2478662 RepID=UPI000EF7503E|nr:DUF1800 domain-containing protein [Acidovorax sp. 1608163]AYM96684.1 DUF1800 domain-containing protein [Acidovorax sp. 1608163]